MRHELSQSLAEGSHYLHLFATTISGASECSSDIQQLRHVRESQLGNRKACISKRGWFSVPSVCGCSVTLAWLGEEINNDADTRVAWSWTYIAGANSWIWSWDFEISRFACRLNGGSRSCYGQDGS